MIAAPVDAVERRAAALAAALAARGASARAARMESAVGGGSLPGETLPSAGVALAVDAPNALAARLRRGRAPVIARIAEGELLLDLRTVQGEEDEVLLAAILAALRRDEVIQ
jgi:L-seryl-tRNA(Ser) seleniumtransferase